ncbi:MAG: right-handed parallel beta-helix repeat-containing protein [archaeon]
MILSLMLVVVSGIGAVNAEGTIYIRADGSIEGTDKIQRAGNLYTFLDNIVVNGLGIHGIIVEKDNIVLDGKGHVLQGQQDETGVGIKLSSITNVTIKNIEIKNFSWGISLYDSLQNTISENTLTNNLVGVHFWAESDSNTISENVITANEDGIVIYGSSNFIVGNTITLNSGYGINFFGSSNTIAGNYIAENGVGVYVDANFPFVGSQNNTIYCNNFINNTQQVWDIFWGGSYSVVSLNVWDNNQTGNYWSNYDGTDMDADGVGDAPYVIDENNQDSYPLMTQVDLTEIPEFPTWTILPILSAITLVALIGKQKLKQNANKGVI